MLWLRIIRCLIDQFFPYSSSAIWLNYLKIHKKIRRIEVIILAILKLAKRSSKIFEIFKDLRDLQDLQSRQFLTIFINSLFTTGVLSPQLSSLRILLFKNFCCFHWFFILFVRWNIRILLFFALIVKRNYKIMTCRTSCTYIHFVYGHIWEPCDEDVFVFIIKQVLCAFILTRILWL